jgi:light-regulated signal transduction histidine kinase (bacteriophytochrome)
VELVEKGGGSLPISYSAARIEDDEKNVLGEVVFIKDMSAYKQAQEELARSNRDLEHFAYVASHDLQEPLRMVISYTQLLKRRYEDKLGEDAQEFIQFAVDGATRMQDMINALLTYSRVQTKGKEPEPMETSSALDRALYNLGVLIEETHAEITHDDLPVVCADETQVIQLFQNLLRNAINYRSGEVPRIHIHSERKGNEWLFSVKDNGIGIDREYIDRIFQIFTRLHPQDTHRGTGIGLAICKRIVERHGGRIWAESEIGEGSTFYFTFPLKGGRCI